MNGQFSTEVVVIGAGVVGLAVARALALAGREVVVLEKNARIGMEISARNSEVIHAGIYYPKNSLKAELCVRGRDLLYEFCGSRQVGHRRLGKLIVAAHAGQEQQLADLAHQAAGNGVSDLKPLSRSEIAALEPELSVAGGFFSPSTGIIDSHAYMLALLGDAEGAGASLALAANVTTIQAGSDGYRLLVDNAGETMTLKTRFLVNSAGLWAPRIASLIQNLDAQFVPPTFLAKGNYAILNVRSPFQHLIYPLPEPGGLGVHLTLDMGGAARFGPDVEWLAIDDPAAIDYAVSLNLPTQFVSAIAEYWPKIAAEMLSPGYSGVRPKIGGPKDPNADFRIEGPKTHGLPGLINLFGIESPGLTASLAIAEKVTGMLHDA